MPQKRYIAYPDPAAPQTYNVYDMESPDGQGHSWTQLAHGLTWAEAQAKLQEILHQPSGMVQLSLF